jgi:hypothetical protein
MARERMCPGKAGLEKKRAATVEVLVWYAASRREASRLRALISARFRRCVGDVRRSSFWRRRSLRTRSGSLKPIPLYLAA